MFQKIKAYKKYGKFYLTVGYTIFSVAFIGVLFAPFRALLVLTKLDNSKIYVVIIAYIEYVRGTFACSNFYCLFGTGVLVLDLSKVAAGCIALSLNSGAYVAEIICAVFRQLIETIGAARSLGMNQTKQCDTSFSHKLLKISYQR